MKSSSAYAVQAPPNIDRLIFWRELATFVPLSRVSVWEMRRRGDFPLGLKLGGRIAWRESEIREWIDSRERA